MLTITEQKPYEEIRDSLKYCKNIYLIGCGTCPTSLHTGGKPEVLEMKSKLEADGKTVAGWMVIPTACDSLTKDALTFDTDQISKADCVLVLSCGFGVQNIAFYCDKPAVPALNSLFVGLEKEPGHFLEACGQCGHCVLASTTGLCPVMRCAKGLFNGPCGGSVNGKCEVSDEIPCIWQMIYDRLKAVGQLDRLDEIQPLQDWSRSSSGVPGHLEVDL